MTIFGLTVGRNEEGRYLEPMLQHMHGVVDEHFFYDDQSDDRTASIANRAGCCVHIRNDQTPSFTENEGAFREDAWIGFERSMNPQIGDWVLVIDCDEVLVATSANEEANTLVDVTRAWLQFTTSSHRHVAAIDLNIPEIWGVQEDGRPIQRIDKLWNTIHAPRLFQYRIDGRYFHGDFGVPAVPQYVQQSQWGNTDALALMHYGYAARSDQKSKYARYTGRLGHSNNHVESIMDPLSEQQLVSWEGPYVKGMSSWSR